MGLVLSIYRVCGPLQDIDITNIVRYMTSKEEVAAGVVYCGTVVHKYCNSVSNAGGLGIKGMIDSRTKASK